MKRAISIAAMAFLLCAVGFAQDESAKKKAAEQSALSWLAVMDAGNYAQSWDDASSMFKAAVTKENWAKMAEAARSPLGKESSRNLVGTEYKTDLPSAPKGEYVVIQYATNFENMPSAIETITPMLDRDGKWHVSGYYIKPAQ